MVQACDRYYYGTAGLWVADLKTGIHYSKNFHPSPESHWEKLDVKEHAVNSMDYSVSDSSLFVARALSFDDGSVTEINDADRPSLASFGDVISVAPSVGGRTTHILDTDIDQTNNNFWLVAKDVRSLNNSHKKGGAL